MPHSISVSATDGQMIAGNERHHLSAANNVRWPSSRVAIMFRPMASQNGTHMFQVQQQEKKFNVKLFRKKYKSSFEFRFLLSSVIEK